jgi:hypothetical protein
MHEQYEGNRDQRHHRLPPWKWQPFEVRQTENKTDQHRSERRMTRDGHDFMLGD